MIFLGEKIRLTLPEQTWVSDLLRIDTRNINSLDQLQQVFQHQLLLLDLSKPYDRLYHKMLVRLYDELLEGGEETLCLDYRLAS